MSDVLPTLLVVEDEALIRLALVDAMEVRGYRVVGAGTADEAVGILTSDLAIDVVVTDVNMPGRMTGLDLAEWVKRNRPSVPVVVTSGAANIDDLHARNLSEARFVEKPYSLSDMVGLVSELVEARP